MKCFNLFYFIENLFNKNMMLECLCIPPQIMYKNLSPRGMKSWSIFLQRPLGRLLSHKGRAHE